MFFHPLAKTIIIVIQLIVIVYTTYSYIYINTQLYKIIFIKL